MLQHNYFLTTNTSNKLTLRIIKYLIYNRLENVVYLVHIKLILQLDEIFIFKHDNVV